VYIPLLIVLTFSYGLESLKQGGLASPQLHDLLLNLLMLQDLAQLKPNVIVGPYLNNSPLWSLSYVVVFHVVLRDHAEHSVDRGAKQAIFAAGIAAALLYVFFQVFSPDC
jgi:hypothetical protein